MCQLKTFIICTVPVMPISKEFERKHFATEASKKLTNVTN
jgi:hypothetical protein